MELRLPTVFILVLLSNEGLAQLACYSSRTCITSTRIGQFSSVRECCEIEQALSYESAEPCGECIIYGWDGNTTMEVKKGQQLNLKVGLLKGGLSSRILLNFDYNSSLVSLNVTEIILGVTNSHVVQVTVYDDGAATTKEVDITITIMRKAGGTNTDVFYDEIILTIPPDTVKVGFNNTNMDVDENAGIVRACFTATSFRPILLEVDTYSKPGTAENPEDYRLSAGSRNITTNSSVCMDIFITNDNTRENDERFTVVLSSSYVSVDYEGKDESVFTIKDTSEAIIALSPERDVLLEGTEGEFCLSLNNSDIDINAIISEKDLRRMQEEVVIDVPKNILLSNDSFTEICIEYTVINDTKLEGIETITVRWVGLEERVTPAEFTLVILDNDDCPELNVRLVGDNNSTGLVEVCHDFEWRSVCDDSWSSKDAKVVCKQLGFLPFIAGLMRRGKFEDEPVKYWLDDLQCRGNETSLFECKPNRVGEHNCRDNERAGVSCLSDSDVGIRLTVEGYIELRMREEWKAVCANFWTHDDARVACRELGTPSTNTRLIIGPYKGRGWMDYVNCKGDEEHLFSCLHIGPNIPCRKRAGVRC